MNAALAHSNAERVGGPVLRALTRSDLADLEISPADVLDEVRLGYLGMVDGSSRCPVKLMMPSPGRDAVSYSMLGFDGSNELVGFKTSYKHGTEGRDKYYTTITLYDDRTGLPSLLMDCDRVGALRTPASAALIARACALPSARSALVIGSGVQGQHMFPFLLAALPQLDRLMVYGTHPEGLDNVDRVLREHHPDRVAERVASPTDAAREADIVITASSRATAEKVCTKLLPPGGVFISVSGKMAAPSALSEADYRIATSAGQLNVTGVSYFTIPHEGLIVDAELAEILAGTAPARRSPDDRVFAFSSGMIITDIPVANALARKALALGRGSEIRLWS